MEWSLKSGTVFGDGEQGLTTPPVRSACLTCSIRFPSAWLLLVLCPVNRSPGHAAAAARPWSRKLSCVSRD